MNVLKHITECNQQANLIIYDFSIENLIAALRNLGGWLVNPSQPVPSSASSVEQLRYQVVLFVFVFYLLSWELNRGPLACWVRTLPRSYTLSLCFLLRQNPIQADLKLLTLPPQFPEWLGFHACAVE